jgi:hypothetical protein
MVQVDTVHVEAVANPFDFSLVPRAALVENLEQSRHFSLLSQEKQETVRIYSACLERY